MSEQDVLFPIRQVLAGNTENDYITQQDGISATHTIAYMSRDFRNHGYPVCLPDAAQPDEYILFTDTGNEHPFLG